MASNPVFFNIYKQISGGRIVVIVLLLLIAASVLFYFNQLAQKLDQREKKYATLYAESMRFFIEQDINNDCDYTFISEVVEANETIPVILVTNGKPGINVNIPEFSDSTKLASFTDKEREDLLYLKIAQMSEEHDPIEIDLGGQRAYLYYSSSLILKELKFFPYVLLATFLIFGSLAFIAYNSSRKAEQNRVWVGLAKETAHQLGTPISALLGWVEVLRSGAEFDDSIAHEMEKDISRLETITNRFSNIGSVPSMNEEDIGAMVENTAKYLEKRISTRINWFINNELEEPHLKMVNKNLFEWVIENLCKNAVDAMSAKGNLTIDILPLAKGKVAIDITDTGKGISKRNLSKVFSPGFSTKKRGWGLGLTLAKRIVETYHQGKLYVKTSEANKGTTFRIII
ncbi:Histidine kinase-, DNA gyrase B-, and HSP90-like ATPase [Spirosomataceae bacterium TFI 002]|nr:Histidine kinase-, DNA gyrase B-, and HSP90-like ATPase [Spirosomataceae bacterium TFI 002]